MAEMKSCQCSADFDVQRADHTTGTRYKPVSFIFPASQQHFVYPFRTPDGKGERRSISFNAVFSSKSEQDKLKKQQEEQQNVEL